MTPLPLARQAAWVMRLYNEKEKQSVGMPGVTNQAIRNTRRYTGIWM